MAIRPEHVVIVEGMTDEPVFEGTVQRAAFLGNKTRLLVDAEGGGRIEIEVHGAGQNLKTGSRLRFALPRASLSRIGGFVMTKHGRLQIWPAADADKVFVFAVVASAAALLLLLVLAPIWAILKYSVVMPDGTFGFGNYTNYIVSARFLGILRNTFEVTIAVTGFTVVLAYGFAYAIERTCMPLKPVLRMIALIPIFSPSLVQALGLQFLLGRNGLINRTFGTEVDIYGFWGIFISNTYAIRRAT